MRVKAVMKVFYDGRDREIGEEFETLDDMHAKVLMISGRVQSVLETRTMKSDDSDAADSRRQKYRTRRLKADE